MCDSGCRALLWGNSTREQQCLGEQKRSDYWRQCHRLEALCEIVVHLFGKAGMVSNGVNNYNRAEVAACFDQLCQRLRNDHRAMDLLEAFIEKATDQFSSELKIFGISDVVQKRQEDLVCALSEYNDYVEMNQIVGAQLPQALFHPSESMEQKHIEISEWAAEILFALYEGRGR